ncbi:Rv1733c family protein [Actinomadura parmotrematis]|uniref:DUF3592 domain-containing protein n=1 Tax=Actinomadura parmotrematis TaxID=2864039 RepID=A0ABS7FME6_9ACTN|nr:hypothetical protein [Actinomadura parmotrematis]MBW8480728.1 hypothetical protein [Actinomadura parmotrematis]
MRRLWRRLGLERNPLRRRIDRLQRGFALALLALLAALAVPAALWCGGGAYQGGTRAERAERASRTQVTATVVASGGVGVAGDRYIHETVQAEWPGPGGETRVGPLPTWKNARPGSREPIWVDAAGRPAPPPRRHSRTVTDAVYAGAGGALAAGAPVLAAYLLVRRRCDRHRADLWEAAWARMDADAGRNRPS